MAQVQQKNKTASGYTIGKNGVIQGDGIPDGVTLDANAYNEVLAKYNGNGNKLSETGSVLNNLYPTMNSNDPLQAKNQPTLSNEVTKFRFDRDGNLLAYIPQVTTTGPSMADLDGGVTSRRADPRGMANANYLTKFKDYGEWVKASGIALDRSTASGAAGNGPFTIRMDQGYPLAVFGNDEGYMRLAMNAPKTADNIRLGNNSGTTSNVRQNAQRRTLL